LASTDCIVRYNRKIESVSEDRSIGPFAHLWFLVSDLNAIAQYVMNTSSAEKKYIYFFRHI
jgi:hypothetical protein